MQGRIAIYLQSFIPDNLDLQKDPDALRRAKVVLYFAFVLALLGPFFALLDFGKGNWHTAWGNLLTALFLFMVPFVQRWSRSVQIAAHTLLTVLFFSLTYLSLITGGYHSVFVFGGISLPMVAILMAGTYAGIFWTLVISIQICGLFLLKRIDLSFPVMSLTMDKEWAVLTSLVGLTIGLTLLSLLYERAKNEALEKLQKSSEARFRSLVEVSFGGIAQIEDDGSIIDANDAFLKMFGRSPHNIQGSKIWEMLSTESSSKVAEKLKLGFEQPCELIGLKKNGGRFPIEMIGKSCDYKGRAAQLIAIRDLTEKKQMVKEIIEISNREQQRIGRDLHDGLCQSLTGIAFLSQVLSQKLHKISPKEAKDAEKIRSMIHDSITQTRRFAKGLHPVAIESQGLVVALRELTFQVQEIPGIQCTLRHDPTFWLDKNDVANHLYRIAQEAISNAIRHGKAKEITIDLTQQEDTLSLLITDNGIGLPSQLPSSRGMGLRNMHYRASMIHASLEVQGSPDGTRVHCIRQESISPKGIGR